MGSALVTAVSKSESVSEVSLYDINSFLANSATVCADGKGKVAEAAADTAEGADFLFIGVKPKDVYSLISEIAPALSKNPGCAIVSMAAGVSISAIAESYANAVKASGLHETAINPIIRIMPNTPVGICEGVIGFATDADEAVKNAFLAITARCGFVKEINESEMNALTAVSGCGPAFVYSFIEGMIAGGVASGLSERDSILLTTATLTGAAKMVELTGIDPAELRRRVCSPGGATIEGVKLLEDANFSGTVKNAVIAAYEKTKKLG
jgi:pyrroline-5-carboxylate reductase